MATKVYFTNVASDVSTAAIDQVADLSPGTGLATAVTNTSNTTVQATDTGGGTVVAWYSPQLVGVTISGTITVNLWCLESGMNANNNIQIAIERCDATGTHISWIVGTSVPLGMTTNNVEIGLSASAQNFNPSLTSRTLVDGDRLGLFVGFGITATQGSGGPFTSTFNYNGATGAANGDSWAQFAETLTIFTPASVPRIDPYPSLLAQ